VIVKADERATLTVGLRLFGAAHLAVLLGWCAWLVAVAPADCDRAWVLAHGPMSVPTRYRRVHELEALRAALSEAGYGLADVADGSSLAAALGAVAA
jgi:hypothetical protein